jgi:hypothetical protein
MANQVYTDPAGYIRQIYVGNQDVTTISQTIEHTMTIVRQHQSEHPDKPLRFLIDMRAIGDQDLSARRAGGKALKNLPYDKIAIFGLNSFMRHVANLVITSARKQDHVKQFKDEAGAVAWLKV